MQLLISPIQYDRRVMRGLLTWDDVAWSGATRTNDPRWLIALIHPTTDK